MKLFNFNSKKKPAKPGAKTASKKKFILSRKQKIIAIVGGVLVLGGAGYWAYSVYGLDSVSAGGCRTHTYSRGASSICVKYAAKLLNAVPGTGKDIKDVDTSFGPQTEQKTKNFQAKHKFSQNGVINAKIWNNLCYDTYSASQHATYKADVAKARRAVGC